MSETLINWPDACVFCGDSNGTIGRTANDHWKQFKCGTEYEVVGEKTAWIQDDDCKIAALMKELAAATKRAEDAERTVAGCRDLIATQRTQIAEAEQERDQYKASASVGAEFFHDIGKILAPEGERKSFTDADVKQWAAEAKTAEQENARLREAAQAFEAAVRDVAGQGLLNWRLFLTAHCDRFAARLAKTEGAK